MSAELQASDDGSNFRTIAAADLDGAQKRRCPLRLPQRDSFVYICFSRTFRRKDCGE